MSVQIETPFLPIFEDHSGRFRAIIEVCDKGEIYPYDCTLIAPENMSELWIGHGLRADALRQHQIARTPFAALRIAA